MVVDIKIHSKGYTEPHVSLTKDNNAIHYNISIIKPNNNEILYRTVSGEPLSNDYIEYFSQRIFTDYGEDNVCVSVSNIQKDGYFVIEFEKSVWEIGYGALSYDAAGRYCNEIILPNSVRWLDEQAFGGGCFEQGSSYKKLFLITD